MVGGQERFAYDDVHLLKAHPNQAEQCDKKQARSKSAGFGYYVDNATIAHSQITRI